MKRAVSACLFLASLCLVTPASPARADVTPTDCTPAPVRATHLIPPYPALSARLGEQGVTHLKVQLDAAGVPGVVAVSGASGSPRLDEAAADYVKKVYRWEPPAAACRTAVAMVDIVWDLQNAPSAVNPSGALIRAARNDFPPDAIANKEEGIVDFQIFVDARGTLLQTRMTRSSGFADLDSVAVRLLAARKFTPGQVDGAPSATAMAVSIAFLRENMGN